MQGSFRLDQKFFFFGIYCDLRFGLGKDYFCREIIGESWYYILFNLEIVEGYSLWQYCICYFELEYTAFPYL